MLPDPQPIVLIPAHCEPITDARKRRMANDQRRANLIPLDYDNPVPAFVASGDLEHRQVSQTECWLSCQPDSLVVQMVYITPRKRMLAVYREINHPVFATREQLEAERVEAFNVGFFGSRVAREVEEKVYD